MRATATVSLRQQMLSKLPQNASLGATSTWLGNSGGSGAGPGPRRQGLPPPAAQNAVFLLLLGELSALSHHVAIASERFD